MKASHISIKEKTRSYVLILCGVAITAMAIGIFLVPNKSVNGGASGLATVLYCTVGLKPSLANAIIVWRGIGIVLSQGSTILMALIS